MDQDKRPAKEPAREQTRPPNDLPEARDPTTQKIHDLSNYNVSDSLGIPLLTKDAGGSPPRSGAEAEGRLFGSRGGERAGERQTSSDRPSLRGVFDVFGYHDRLALAAVFAMILGPLFFGAFHR